MWYMNICVCICYGGGAGDLNIEGRGSIIHQDVSWTTVRCLVEVEAANAGGRLGAPSTSHQAVIRSEVVPGVSGSLVDLAATASPSCSFSACVMHIRPDVVSVASPPKRCDASPSSSRRAWNFGCQCRCTLNVLI